MNIKLLNISKSFAVKGVSLSLFSNINLNIDSEYSYGITGNSGVGKTTLIHMIGGIENLSNGRIKYYEENIEVKKTSSEIFSFVFQDHNLINELTVEENLLLPLMIKKINIDEAKNKIIYFLNELNMIYLQHSNLMNLSGGQKQRIAILRAVLAEPKFILADEPCASLDKENSKLVIDLLLKIHKEQKIGLILTSHESDIYNKLNFNINLENKSINLIQIT